jgi:hypothetical protein
LYRYFVSQPREFCRHNPLCCFSTSNTKGNGILRYRLSPETFEYTLVLQDSDLNTFGVLSFLLCNNPLIYSPNILSKVRFNYFPFGTAMFLLQNTLGSTVRNKIISPENINDYPCRSLLDYDTVYRCGMISEFRSVVLPPSLLRNFRTIH